eukprot:TRINITY_DN12626_c0_g1_i4.p1 TRINITY_DN12626_c0_g1~~TRINITY_DN12626_c0_g1_i4.p1  ORF type:complete len:155 (+),score=19.27 TRINITY_DN12626_c0_g1_i4:151-615(+)
MRSSDDLSSIAAKVPEMNVPCFRTNIEANWEGYGEDINERLIAFSKILAPVTTLVQIIFLLNETATLNDEGCATIADLLRNSPAVSTFHLHMFGASITDLGISFLASELSLLPLQEIEISFGSTQVTDRGLIYLSQALCHLSSQLNLLTVAAPM